MKTITRYLVLVILCVSTLVSAQDFQGVATYKSHRKMDFKISGAEGNSEMQKSIQAQVSKQFQQEYTLIFNKNESTYKRNEKLETPSPQVSGLQISIMQSSDILYKNIKENRFTNETEIFGKQFLVKDSLQSNKWELVNETKNIGNYTCFKAIFNEEYTTQTINDDNEIEKVTKERTTTAWYTPEIPVNNGPNDFHGLPGLILEINDGQLTLVCSKIVMNPKEKIAIKEPTKGKEVTQKKFDEIVDKKTKEMMDRVQSRRGDGENVFIRVGG
jgi:GLPGLI family protein